MSYVFLQNIKRGFYVFKLNPVFLLKRIFFELKATFLPLPESGIFEGNGVNFDFDFSFSHKIKKMYFGTFQPIISEVIKKYLKKGDTFIDAGANIGYFSFIATSVVGEQGRVYSFEPVPEYFLRLENFAKINKKYKIKANKLALGNEEKNAKIFIKGGTDIGNNTFFPELLDSKNVSESTETKIIRLDKYIKENNLKNIGLIKIDVEGFEFATLKGLSGYFSECSKNNTCPVIVCEIVPEIYPKLGYKMEDLFLFMSEFGYSAYNVLNNNIKTGPEDIIKNRVADVIFKPPYIK